MIIKEIRVHINPFTLGGYAARGGGASGPRELVVVEVETSSGLVGLGYVMPLRGGIETIGMCLKELIVPRLIGKEATQIEAIWQDLWRATYTVGRMGITLFAISAIDIALWGDLLGKKAGLPLYKLWEGFQTEIPAYGSGCWRGLGAEGMIEKAKSYLAQGFKAVKMQVGFMPNWQTEVERVRLMREALGSQYRHPA